jgi:GNAT superfamily N-acetyltransferase
MVTVRPYCEDDRESVGILIADTFSEFNLSFALPEERGLFLGPFRHARSPEPAHREAIAAVIRAPMVFVAEDDAASAGRGEIVGVLRGGRLDRLQSLFVKGTHQRRGIGRQLVERFERESLARGATVIHLAATVYAVPFYARLGYVKSTGLRHGTSFEGTGLPVQPMKKTFENLG